jgi:hypothetical protein
MPSTFLDPAGVESVSEAASLDAVFRPMVDFAAVTPLSYGRS